MDDLSDLRFTQNDEWIRPEGDVWMVGITDYAQGRLGDIVHVDLPEPDEHRYEVDDDIGMIESLTDSLEIRAPVAGIVTEINTALLSSPERINSDPYEAGWIIRLRPDHPDELDDLMDIIEYESGLPEEDEE